MKSGRILLSGRWGLNWHPYLAGRFHSREKYSKPITNQTSYPHLSPVLILHPFLVLHLVIVVVVVVGGGGGGRVEAMALAAEAQFHVLAVDDSLIDRKLIERLLKTSSYQVTAVDSGSKALEFLGLQDDQTISPSVPSDHEIEVNLVITDYCMPGMTGYDLLKRIKESSSLKDIPVVIMSSENVPSRINRCLEEGAEEFLLKPVQLSDMKRLRPHILKGKSKEQQQQPQPSPDSPPIQDNTTTTTIQDSNSISSNSNSDSSNKRKAIEGGLSPGRTRPRFSSSSLTVV